MKVLFLDIDGVLNGGYYARSQSKIWTPQVYQLQTVLDATKCKVVLSSAWRTLIRPDAMTLYGFQLLLWSHGLVVDLIGMTDQNDRPRWNQILDHVALHPEIEKFAAVDDQALTDDPRFVRTAGNVGLTALDAQKLIQVLS